MKNKTPVSKCYECQWRGNIPGDAHSCCTHPKNKAALDDPYKQMMAIFASVRRVEPVLALTGIAIELDAHGVRNGWCNWPYNFDPIWVKSCDGFEAKTPRR